MKLHFDSIVIFPSPSVADPAHLITHAISGGTFKGRYHGGRIVRFLIKVLYFFVKREIEKTPSFQRTEFTNGR
jgi:hypothetical protein